MRRSLKLVTFDATGTLMNFQPPVAVKYSECAKKFGISVDIQDLMRNFGVHWKELSRSHPNYGKETGLGWRAWYTQIVIKTFESAAPSSDKETLKKLAAFMIEEYQTKRCWELTDGALDILNFLKVKGIPLGIISNYDERLENTLKSLEIHSYFNFILTSYAAGVMKPSRTIFDLARSKMQCDATPEQCAHIGDTFELDYQGAKNAGWNPIHVGPLDAELLKEVDNYSSFGNLSELRQYFEKVLL